MLETNFYQIFKNNMPLYKILPMLLIDHNTNRNIVWGTNTYQSYGIYFINEKEMTPEMVIYLIERNVLLPRNQKNKEEQQYRTKNKAEVFTPSWICNKMNNHLDEDWFGKKNVFNTEIDINDSHSWQTNEEKIPLSKKEWQNYIKSTRLEITCGEAPYIVSRYDTTTGDYISVKNRIGILDRKLRIINENTNTEQTWLKWVRIAYKSVYGFEYQGDNLFFARTNLLQTFIEYYVDRFDKNPSIIMLKKIAEIISWNFWQMNGLTDKSPYGTPKEMLVREDSSEYDNVYCKIKDWENDSLIEYRAMKGEKVSI